jgi:hypothetical protein
MLADQALTETPIDIPRSVLDRSMLIFEYATAVIVIAAVALLAVFHCASGRAPNPNQGVHQ